MRTILPIAALLFTATTAWGESHAKLTYQGRLENALRMPVAISPDGKTVLYFTRTIDEASGEPLPKQVYTLADVDGKNPRPLFESPVEEAFLNSLVTDRSFSPDGKQVVVATSDNGHMLRDEENPGRVVPLIVSPDGKQQRVDCELGSCGGFGFVAGGLLVLDTPGLISGEGYQLRLQREGESKLIQSDDKLAASCLRISPDGTQAAFFVSTHVASAMVRLRCVDLISGAAKDSPEFRSHQATFDGRPQLFWDDASEGVYCHVSTHQQSKWPFEATHYNFATGKGKALGAARDSGMSCTLSAGRLVLWHYESDGCSVFDAQTGKFHRLPDNNYILGGRDERVVVADMERNAIYMATFKLVDAARPNDLEER